MRFLKAENLYLMNRGDQAAKAYGEFVKAGKEHPIFSRSDETFQVIMMPSDGTRPWQAPPLLEKKPEGVHFRPVVLRRR